LILRENIPRDDAFEEQGLTPFALAMPDQYKVDDFVQSYRNYYIGEKKGFATWKNREIPYWFN
jgi:hypothetical protein